MLAPVALVPRPGTSLAALDRWLIVGAGCAPMPDSRLSRTYLDTFDGRLFRSGLVLEHELLEGRRWLRARRIDDTSALAQAQASLLGPGPRLSDDALSNPRLRAVLAGPCGARALLAWLHTEGTLRRYRLTDELDKAVVRVSVTTGWVRRADRAGPSHAPSGAAPVHQRIGSHQGIGSRVSESVRPPGGVGDRSRSELLDPVITVNPVRGHDQAFRQLVVGVTSRFGCRPAGDPLRRAADIAGAELGMDPAARAVALSGADSSFDAVSLVLARLAQVVSALEPGVRAGWDGQFVVDFHATLRAALAVVGAAQGVIGQRYADALTAHLTRMAMATRAVRDLDVADLSVTVVEPVADPISAALVPALVAAREAAHRVLLAELDSPGHRETLALLSTAARGPDGSGSSASVWARTALLRGLERGEAARSEGHGGWDAAAPGRCPLDALAGLIAAADLLEVLGTLYPHDVRRGLGSALGRVERLLDDHRDGEVSARTLASAGAQLADAPPAVLIGIGERVERARAGARLAWHALPEAVAAVETHRHRWARRLSRSTPSRSPR